MIEANKVYAVIKSDNDQPDDVVWGYYTGLDAVKREAIAAVGLMQSSLAVIVEEFGGYVSVDFAEDNYTTKAGIAANETYTVFHVMPKLRNVIGSVHIVEKSRIYG